MNYKIQFVILALVLGSCDSEFAGTPKFGDGKNKPSTQPDQTGDANPFEVGQPVERDNGETTEFSNGNDYLQNAQDDLVGGSGNRDCNKEALLDEAATVNVAGHIPVNNIVNENCLTGLPGAAAVFNGDKEKKLLCNLLGYQTVVTFHARDWASRSDNFTAQFEESGVDEKTGLQKGQLVNKPANSVPNSWIDNITCSGKLHDQCQYFRNEQGKIDCTGL